MSIKKIVLASFLVAGFSTAFAASDCTYSAAQSRNLSRTINLVNQIGNAQLSFGSKTPSSSNPTMAWEDDPNNTNANNGVINLGICCNDQMRVSPLQ